MANARAWIAAAILSAAPLAAQEIVTTTLASIDSNAVGLVTARNAGLPVDFWRDAPASVVTQLIDDQHFHQMPEARQFLHRLMVAELVPPKDDTNGVSAITSRIDWLLDNGFVDAADALLEKVGPTHPDIFKRWVDAKLMLGHAQDACEPLKVNPALTDDLSTKIYCLVQNQDWFSAELTLVSGMNLGVIDRDRGKLLSLFLDPDLMGEIRPPQIQNASDPMEFALREALALPRPSKGITLSQSHIDLDDAAGWLAQLRAGEDLARTGAIPAQYLGALYASGKASASGGIWERVKSVTKLRTALLGSNSETTCDALLAVWDRMASVKLSHVFADIFAETIAAQTLPERCHEVQINTILLHKNYGVLLFDYIELIETDDVTLGLLQDDFSNAKPKNRVERAVINAFQTPPVSLVSPAQSVLSSFAKTTNGIDSDARVVQALLETLRSAGFVAEAQRLALQYIVMERTK